jgi:hypothetical protein
MIATTLVWIGGILVILTLSGILSAGIGKTIKWGMGE